MKKQENMFENLALMNKIEKIDTRNNITKSPIKNLDNIKDLNRSLSKSLTKMVNVHNFTD